MPAYLLFTLLLLLVGCKDETQATRAKQAEAEARQRAELAQAQAAKAQAEQAQRQAVESRERLQTLRIVALVALAGGAVLAIAWSGRPPASPVVNGLPNRLPIGQPQERLVASLPVHPAIPRVIDMPPVNPAERPVNPAHPAARRRRRRNRSSAGQPAWHHTPPPQSNYRNPTPP